MLFQHSPPLYLKAIEPNKIVILTRYRIIYSFIDKFTQSLYSILVQQNPVHFQYSIQRQQSLVVTQKSIQIYSCNFVQQVNLKKVIILNEERVYSVIKGAYKDWQIFGEIYQYSSKNVKIHSIEPRSMEEQAIGQCYVEQFQVYVTKSKLICVYDHKKQIGEEIRWSEQTKPLQIFLKSLNPTHKPTLQAHKLYYPDPFSNHRYSTINECKSQLCVPPSSKQPFNTNPPKSSSFMVKKRQSSQLHPHSVYPPSCQNSRVGSSFCESEKKEFVIIVEIESKFVLVLVPPQKEYFSSRMDVESRARTTKWSMVRLDMIDIKSHKSHLFAKSLHSLSSETLQMQTLQTQILHQSAYHNFSSPTSFSPEQMGKMNLLSSSNKQLQDQFEQWQGLWMISRYNSVVKSQKSQSMISPPTIQGVILSLVKLESRESENVKEEQECRRKEQIDEQSQNQTYTINLFMDQNHSRTIHIESFLIPPQPLTQYRNEHNDPSPSKQFVQVLLSSASHHAQNVSSNKNSSKVLIELIKIENHQQNSTGNLVTLTFVYYAPINKSKSLNLIRVKAMRLVNPKTEKKDFAINKKPANIFKTDHPRDKQGKGIFSSNLTKIPSNTSSQLPLSPKTAPPPKISTPPLLIKTLNITSSQSLSAMTPITSSQPLTLTYSDDASELAAIQLLSRIPSVQSHYSEQVYDRELSFKLSQIRNSQNLRGNEGNGERIAKNDSNSNPLKQSRNRSQIDPSNLSNKNSFSFSLQTKPPSSFQSIQQSIQTKTSPYLLKPTHSPINEVSEEHYNDESLSKYEQESVEQVMQIIDFKPVSSNKIIGAGYNNSSNTFERQTSENNNNNNDSKIIERIEFDVSIDKNLMKKKNSLESNSSKPQSREMFDPFLIKKNSSSSNKNITKNNKNHGLDHSLENEPSQKEFYQKFINHFNQRKQEENNTSQSKFKEINDSRESYEKNFHNSKASDSTKKQNMQNMIGKDISEIVHQGKNLGLITDDEVSCSEEETIELGQEIEKEYSRNLTRKSDFKHVDDEKAGEGLFSKYNNSVSYSQPTVILLDKLQVDEETQNREQTSPDRVHYEYDHFIHQHNDSNNPDTPAFNQELHHFENDHSLGLFKQPQIGIVSNDQWGNFTKKWNMTTNPQLNQNDEFNMKDSGISLKGSQFMRESRSKLITCKQLQKLSKKVKAFCHDQQRLTWDEAREIEAKKYTQLMRQMFVRSEEKFNSLMREFLPQIIREEEARLFFAEYIRTFSGKTRDILVRLYMSLPDTQENKRWMSKALSEFKLSQVPEICLPIPKDIIQIFKYLYPCVFIQDLLKPSIFLYQKLLQNYFSLQRLPVDQVTIEDQQIDLSHPRNMLNIMLYLNEQYNLSMTQLFEVYCTELIKNDCSEIVIKMLKEEQTFEICEVNKAMLEDIVENTIIDKIKECSTNIQWIGKSLEILACNLSSTSLKLKEELTLLLNVIDSLNLSDCFFSIDTLFKLSEVQNLFAFCNTLIRQNNCTNLQKLQFQQMYKDLHQIAYGQTLKYYNQQLKDLLQILCEKYFQNESFCTAFNVIAPIITITKRGFIAKMLFKYMEGKLMNRLSNRNFATKTQFVSTFRQFFTNLSPSQRSIKSLVIEHDVFGFEAENSYLVNCPYFKFYSMYTECVHSTQCEEVIYICYTDYQLASELASYHVLNKKEWQDLSQALNDYVPKEEIKKLVSKTVFKFNSRIKIADDQEAEQNEEDHLMPTTSLIMRNSKFLNLQPQKKNNQLHIKSLQAIDFEQANKRTSPNKKNNMYRSKSDPFVPQEGKNRQEPIDPYLQSLKYEVNPEVIKSTLKQLYQKIGSTTRMKDFLKALSIIDRERIKICHYEKFKTITNLQLDFQIQKLLPFQFFLTQDYEKSFQLIKSCHLFKKLTIKNFWSIYIILEILLSKGQQITIMMIQKLVSEFKSESLANVVDQILNKCKISQQNLKLLAIRAKMEGQVAISERIKERILQKNV